MEENKFEKQVQEKMDELKIHPSDSVWEKIEVRIEKRKRSKRELFFFLLLSALLMGGYLLWNINDHSTKERNNTEKNNENKNNQGKTSGDVPLTENKTMGPKKNLIPGPIHQTPIVAQNTTKKKNIHINSSQRYKHSTDKREPKINSGQEAVIVSSPPQNAPGHIYESAAGKPVADTQTVVEGKNEKFNAESKGPVPIKVQDSVYVKFNNDSLSKPAYAKSEKEKDTKVKDTIKKIPASPETVKHSKKNGWKPGVVFAGGISNVSTSLLNDDKSLFASYPNVSVSGPGMATPRPSATKAGFGFMIGVFAEKNVSPKVKLGLGINFKSFKTSNQVGTRNDTTGFYDYQLQNRVNTNSVYNTYNNHYNFIELPLTFKVQIGRGKKMPVIWQAGFTVSELISSNALQFNQSQGYYYNNNSIFNKTQTGFNTALLIALFSKQKVPLLLGPYFNYSTSVLAREGLYNKEHFIYTGIRTEIIFGK